MALWASERQDSGLAGAVASDSLVMLCDLQNSNPFTLPNERRTKMASLIKLDVATDVCCTIAEFLGSSKLRGYIIRIHTGHEPCTVFDLKSGNSITIPADQYIEIDLTSESPTGIGQDQDRFTGSVWHLLPDDRVSIQTDDVEALLVQCKEPGFAKGIGSDKWNFPTIYFDANGITRIDNRRV